MSDYHQSPRTAPNSSMAILSLIAGILGLTMFPVLGSIAALITGQMAKREINESGGTLGGEGLAQAGIIMGWIGVALTVLGVCIFGAVFALPFCLGALGLASGEWSSVVPMIMGVI